MATYDNLPVFKACYDLMLYVTQWSVNVARDMRYTIAEDMKKSMVEVLRCVYRANKALPPHKSHHISLGLEAMMEAKLYLRILYDCRQSPGREELLAMRSSLNSYLGLLRHFDVCSFVEELLSQYDLSPYFTQGHDGRQSCKRLLLSPDVGVGESTPGYYCFLFNR